MIIGSEISVLPKFFFEYFFKMACNREIHVIKYKMCLI